jgi:urea transport system permease protein
VETLLATWGVGIALQVIVKLIFGPELLYAGAPAMIQGSVPLIGLLPVPRYTIFLLALAIVMVAGTFYLLFKTNFGLKVRAVRRNRAISGCLGIDTAKVDMMIFTFGSGLAGIAGAALAPIKSVSPPMGFPYAVDSYMVLVLGGVGNLWGVVAGSAVIGEAESVLSFVFNNVIGKLLVFLFIVLIIRIVPKGIFGYYERR